MTRPLCVVLAACGLLAVLYPTTVPADDPASLQGSRQPVTYHRDIAPLLFEHCATCHRPGEVAPFPLLTYNDARRRGSLLAELTAERLMPPWKSVEGHGHFVGERRLTAAQIALLERWVADGMPEGDPADAPPVPLFRDGWALGEPDLVLRMPDAYEIPADGPDIYRNFVFPLELPAGKFIKGAEFRPSNRGIVHHASLSYDVTDKSRRLDADDPAPGFKGSLNIPGRLFPGTMEAWTPGREPSFLPADFSLPWPTGADLVLQLHLHPSGKPEREQSEIGLYLTDEAPRRSMADLVLIQKGIDIPAGEAHYRSWDECTLPIDMELFGIFPHMHLIGRDIKLLAIRPGEEPETLIWIDDWDFNWQNLYEYTTPVRLPAGTTLVMEGVHDNSADNFRNPNQPPKRVRAGEQTTDEMCAVVLQLVPVSEVDLPKLVTAHGRRLVGGITARVAE